MDNKRVEKYLKGFQEEQELQEDISKPGDPQLAALSTFFQSKKSQLNKDDVIIDFGCGRGILAKLINALWKELSDIPFYIAVDFEEMLTKVSFPPRVHNSSMKIVVDDFYNNFPKSKIDKIKLVVIRNVLHELNILETARLIHFLANLNRGFEIYIQDMQNLPKAERGKAGWIPEILIEYLKDCNYLADFVPHESFGGTKWFSIIAVTQENNRSLVEVNSLTAKYREQQKNIILEKIIELNKSQAIDEIDIVTLQNDNSSLDLQLLEYRNQKPNFDTNIYFTFRNTPVLPLVYKAAQEFAIPTEDFYKINGMIGLLVNKNIIDFSGLVQNCKKALKMLGYSNSSLFQNIDTRKSLKELLTKKEIEVKILICNPESEAARLRNTESLYAESDLILDIKETLNKCKEFLSDLNDDEQAKIEVKLFDKIAYTSIVLFDDYCLVSNYSNRISGSSGNCMVYHNNTNCTNNTYKVIEQEFHYRWEESLKFSSQHAQ